MNDKKPSYQAVYNHLADWFEQVNEHEITDLVDLMETAKAYLHAAEELTQDETQMMLDSLQRDLQAFYQWQEDASKTSLWFNGLKNSFWQALAQMTDRSQVEWGELLHDIEHSGVYQPGDFVGFGQLVCKKCQHQQEIVKPTQVTACIECGHNRFERIGLEP